MNQGLPVKGAFRITQLSPLGRGSHFLRRDREGGAWPEPVATCVYLTLGLGGGDQGGLGTRPFPDSGSCPSADRLHPGPLDAVSLGFWYNKMLATGDLGNRNVSSQFWRLGEFW